MNLPNYEQNPILYEKCFKQAVYLKEKEYVYQTNEITLFGLTDLLFSIEEERQIKTELSDRFIDYEDEIVSIEEVGILPTIDITVTGDNLFYCNGILTKNSIGLPQTVDMLFALIGNEELDQMNQIIVKQIKNRYNDVNYFKRFVVGLDKSKMKFYDVEATAQQGLFDSGQNKPVAEQHKKPNNGDNKFNDFKF
jgi:hypothetical protein